MKREWKVFLKYFDELEANKPAYRTCVCYYETTVNLVARCLNLKPEFCAAYEVYPGVLGAVRNRDAAALETVLEIVVTHTFHHRFQQPYFMVAFCVLHKPLNECQLILQADPSFRDHRQPYRISSR